MVCIASRPRMVVVALFTVAVALGVFLVPARAGPAQQPPYPAPCPCVVVVSAGEAVPSIGECIPIMCRVTDTEGAPVVDLECMMSVVSQPGTDASLTPASAMTDEKGEATVGLCVGSTSGSIVVLAETDCCDSQGQVEVTAQMPLPVVAPEVSPVAPPPTGAGTGASGDSWPVSLIAIWSAIAVAAVAVFAWQVSSWRHRNT
jgi:hypothetical protein